MGKRNSEKEETNRMEKVNVFECLVLYGFFIHWGKIDFDGFWEVIFLLFFFFFFVFGFEGRNLGKRKKMEGRFSKEGLDESTVHSMVISNVFSDHSAPFAFFFFCCCWWWWLLFMLLF